MSWKKQAAAWLRHKAEVQARTNEAYPEHAKAYPSWAERIGFAQQWASELEHEAASEAGEPPLAIVWRPMTERPADITTAMIRHTDAEGAHLMPGPVEWSIPQQRWISERTALPVELGAPGSTYHWCYERDIVGDAA